MAAVGIGPIGPFEGLIILAVVVLIFGVGKLSEVGGALGKSIREFRKAAREPDESEQAPYVGGGGTAGVAQATTATCTKCGAELAARSKFCNECGAPVGAAVK
jgi:sec-independent protein translocase protein TatA